MKTTIISLGGSLIYPNKRDYAFLAKFKYIIDSTDGRFIIFCGGGHLARKLQKIGKFFHLSRNILDWIGIFATRRNALAVKKMFENVHNEIINNPSLKFEFNEKIAVACGWKPGWSTDYCAVVLAENLGIGSIINMSNVEYVYDKDPNLFLDAKIIEKIKWSEFKEIVGDTWQPGMNKPFDPIASKKAAEIGLKVFIIGKDTSNLKNLIEGRKFKGTVIN